MLTVVTPVLNGVKYIAKCIESIRKLDINFEHIVVDGGSSDGTLEVITRYPHINLIHQNESTGMYGAIHQGIARSSGTHLTWINADDMIIPEAYAKLYATILLRKADLAYSHCIVHREEKPSYTIVFARHYARYFLKYGIMPFSQPGTIFSRSAYDVVGGLNYNLFRVIGDRDLFQRMAYRDDLIMLFVPVVSSIFLRRQDALSYAESDLIAAEKTRCVKTPDKPSILYIAYHLSQLARYIGWNTKISVARDNIRSVFGSN